MPDLPTPVTANPFRPGTQAELSAHLANTVGLEVEAALAAIEGRAIPDPAPSTSPPADAPPAEPSTQGTATAKPDTPTAPPATPETPPQIDVLAEFESLRDPETGLILRKWKKPEDALRGTHNLIKYAGDALKERDRLQEQLAEIRSGASPTAPSQPTTAPAPTSDPLNRATSRRTEVLSRLNEKYELAPDDLGSLIDVLTEEASTTARQAVREELTASQQRQAAEQDGWREADEYMVEHFPSFASHVDALELFVKSNATVASSVRNLMNADDRVGAMSTAWLNYCLTNGLDPTAAVPDPSTSAPAADPAKVAEEHALQVQQQVTKGEIDQARIDAGLVPAQTTGIHAPVPTGPTPEQRAAAVAAFRAGDKRAFNEMVFGKLLPEGYFDIN